MSNPRAQLFIRQKLGVRSGVNFESFFADADADCVDLLEGLLRINPRRRLTVDEALEHPCFAAFYNSEALEEKNCGALPFVFEYDHEAVGTEKLMALFQGESCMRG